MKKSNHSSLISSHLMPYLLLGLILPGGPLKSYHLQAADFSRSLAQQCADLLVSQTPRALPPAVTLEEIAKNDDGLKHSQLLIKHYFSTPLDFSLETAWGELFNDLDTLLDDFENDNFKTFSQVEAKVARMYWQNPAKAQTFFQQKIKDLFSSYAKSIVGQQKGPRYNKHLQIVQILHEIFQETNLTAQFAPAFQAGVAEFIRILSQESMRNVRVLTKGISRLEQIIPDYIWPDKISSPQDLQLINDSLASLVLAKGHLKSFPTSELAHVLAMLVDQTAITDLSPLKNLLAAGDKNDAPAVSDDYFAEENKENEADEENNDLPPLEGLINTLNGYAQTQNTNAEDLYRMAKYGIDPQLPKLTTEDLLSYEFWRVIHTSPQFAYLILDRPYFQNEHLPDLVDRIRFIQAFNDTTEIILTQIKEHLQDKATLSENFKLEYYNTHLMPIVHTLQRIAQIVNPDTSVLPEVYWPSLQNCLAFIQENLAYIYHHMQEEQKMMNGVDTLIASLKPDLSSWAQDTQQDITFLPKESTAPSTAAAAANDTTVLLHEVFKTQYVILLSLIKIINPRDVNSQWKLYEILNKSALSSAIKDHYRGLILNNLPIFLKANRNFKGLTSTQEATANSDQADLIQNEQKAFEEMIFRLAEERKYLPNDIQQRFQESLLAYFAAAQSGNSLSASIKAISDFIKQMDVPSVMDRVMDRRQAGSLDRSLLLKIYDNIFNLYPTAAHGEYLYQAKILDSIIYFTQRDALLRPTEDHQHPFLLENNSQFNLRWADHKRSYWYRVKELLAAPQTSSTIVRYWQENYGKPEGGIDFERLNDKVGIQLFDIGITALIRSFDKISREEFAAQVKQFCEFFIAPEELSESYSPARPEAINLLIILYRHLVSHPLAQLDRRAIVADLQQILNNCATQSGQTITHMDPAAILTDATLAYELILRTQIVNVHLAARDFSNVLSKILGFSSQDFHQYARGMAVPFISAAIQYQEIIESDTPPKAFNQFVDTFGSVPGTARESAGLFNNISQYEVGQGDDWRVSEKNLKVRALAQLEYHEYPEDGYGITVPFYEISTDDKLEVYRYRAYINIRGINYRWYKTTQAFASYLVHTPQSRVSDELLRYQKRGLTVWEAEQLQSFQISKYNL